MKIIIEDREELETAFTRIKKFYNSVKRADIDKILKSKIKYDVYFIYCDLHTDFNKYSFTEFYKVVFLTNCVAVNHIEECANLSYTKDIISIKSELLEKKIIESILSIEWSGNEENIDNCNYCT